jgi:hypothetical protein
MRNADPRIHQVPAAIRTLNEEMMEGFARATHALLKVTRAHDFTVHQKGLFGVAYFKPVRRVARLLAAYRELLVLCSTFEDQQQRTVNLAADIIYDSDGRLEKTIAVILHRDMAGDRKLKNWGRELGLRVIPLFMPNCELPGGDRLERMLFSEFYSHDPFDITGPVHEDDQFYGRRDEAQDLARQLQQGQIRSCLGIRKIGKTSVINRVLFLLQDYDDCHSVMIDCSKDIVFGMNAAQLLDVIASSVDAAILDKDSYAEVAALTTERPMADAYNNLVAAVRRAPGPVILFFDEVDYITPGSTTAAVRWRTEFNTFWRNLRAVYQELTRTNAVLSVLISGVSSKWFRVESIDGIENAALTLIPEEYLSPLPAGASVAMLNDIGSTAGLLFDEGAARLIAEASSNIPYWSRKAASHVHRAIETESRPCHLAVDLITSLVDEFIDSEGAAVAELALGHLFRVYPELKSVATACYNVDGMTQPAQLTGILERYGVVKKSRGGNPVISGKMMREGMRHYLEGARATQEDGTEPAYDALRFASVDEWAEELAALGALRNKIELLLRTIGLNFIRFSSLQDKNKASVAERVLRVIDTSRRTRLQALTPDEAIKKFLWTDLVALIDREWELFAPIFADKGVFRRHADVLNQRYDAHAKDIDRASVAEYRRSAQWFEESLSRM